MESEGLFMPNRLEHLLTVLAYCMELQVSSKGIPFKDLDEYVNRNDLTLASRREPKKEEDAIIEEGQRQLAIIKSLPGAIEVPIQ